MGVSNTIRDNNPDRVEELDEGVDDVLLDVGHDESELGEALGKGQEHGAEERRARSQDQPGRQSSLMLAFSHFEVFD